MPTEALILRRTFPVPVTFADLRRARDGVCQFLTRAKFYANAKDAINHLALEWHAAIKESTGALDEVYAVIDGREVRVATVDGPFEVTWVGDRIDRIAHETGDLLEKADEAGYWQRPHEVRRTLEESQMSHRTMARIAGNSFIVAGSK